MALNVLWSALALPWLILAFLVVGLAAPLRPALRLGGWLLAFELVIYSPPTVLLFLGGRRWAKGEDAPFRELFEEWKRLAWRAQQLGLLVLGATFALLFNMLFYRHFAGWGGLILSGMMGWLLLSVLLTALYLFPVLVAGKKGIWQTVRHSLLLVLDNFWVSFRLLLTGAVFVVSGMLSVLGLFCGLLAALALLISICYAGIQAGYDGAAPLAPPRRSWRELIRPWEG